MLRKLQVTNFKTWSTLRHAARSRTLAEQKTCAAKMHEMALSPLS